MFVIGTKVSVITGEDLICALTVEQNSHTMLLGQTHHTPLGVGTGAVGRAVLIIGQQPELFRYLRWVWVNAVAFDLGPAGHSLDVVSLVELLVVETGRKRLLTVCSFVF